MSKRKSIANSGQEYSLTA